MCSFIHYSTVGAQALHSFKVIGSIRHLHSYAPCMVARAMILTLFACSTSRSSDFYLARFLEDSTIFNGLLGYINMCTMLFTTYVHTSSL